MTEHKIGDKIKFSSDITLDERNHNDRAIEGSLGVITDIDEKSDYPYYIEFDNANGKKDTRVFTEADICSVEEYDEWLRKKEAKE